MPSWEKLIIIIIIIIINREREMVKEGKGEIREVEVDMER